MELEAVELSGGESHLMDALPDRPSDGLRELRVRMKKDIVLLKRGDSLSVEKHLGLYVRWIEDLI